MLGLLGKLPVSCFTRLPHLESLDVFFKRTLVKGAIPTRHTDGGNSPGLLLIDREARQATVCFNSFVFKFKRKLQLSIYNSYLSFDKICWLVISPSITKS